MTGAPTPHLVSFDPATAVNYGLFVKLAYDMHGNAPSNPTPAPPAAFPSGYTFHAWVQMKDFIIGSTDWSFYGVMARSTTDPNDFVLAIRGTSNLEEWWDDLTSIVTAPWKGFGQVGFGFNRIYETLRLVEYHSGPTAGMAPGTQSMEPAGSFARQVATSTQHTPPHAAGVQAMVPSAPKVHVVGHSLGSALATLYVAENASVQLGAVATPLLCTFASPRVGDPTFKAAFDQLPVASWRIVNELDIVPKLPAIGFAHIDTLHGYNSRKDVHWSLACWHALDTYLHLLDPKQPISGSCQPWLAATAAAAPLRAAPPPLMAATPDPTAKAVALSLPSETGATIEITIKVT